MFASPIAIASPLPPIDVRRFLLDGLECIRLADVLIGRMRESPGEEIDDYFLRAGQVNFRVYGAIFQELVGDVLPTIEPRVFATLKDYRNRWPESHGWIEATVLTCLLAYRQFDSCLTMAEDVCGPEHNVLIDLMYGGRETVEAFVALLGSSVAMTTDDVLESVIAGSELPPFATQEDVERARELWAKSCEESQRDAQLLAESREAADDLELAELQEAEEEAAEAAAG